jgi:hypothetical protein
MPSTAALQPTRSKIAMNQPSTFWVRHAALVFALRTFAAATLAFSIALRLDMPRPYWAMASVYITSSQLSGATLGSAPLGAAISTFRKSPDYPTTSAAGTWRTSPIQQTMSVPKGKADIDHPWLDVGF